MDRIAERILTIIGAVFLATMWIGGIVYIISAVLK